MRQWAQAFPDGTNRTRMSGPGSSTEALKMARRLDWRFLLPEPALRRVAYFGSGGDLLSEALRRFSEEFVPVRSGAVATRGDREDCDLAVVASRRSEDLRAAYSRLRPGGLLYWEVDRRPGLFGTGPQRDAGDAGARVGRFLTTPHGNLQSLGFEHVRVSLALPHARNPRAVLSPDSTAVRFTLALAKRKLYGLDHCASFASRIGLLPRILPGLLVVARRPGGRPSVEGMTASAFLGEQESGSHAEELSWVLLSRRGSSFAMTFLLREGSERPAAVVKSARLPGHARAEGALAREAGGLRTVAEIQPSITRSVPTVLADGRSGGTRSLTLSGMPGAALSRHTLRRDPEGWADEIVHWLIDLHKATSAAGTTAPDRYDCLVRLPIRELERHLPQSESHQGLILRADRALEDLASFDLPAVLEHGDLCGSNILAGAKTPGETAITVVDWEFAEARGFPAIDLFFFLASMALAREPARTWDEKLQTMHRAFRRTDGWAHPWISRYWEALELPSSAAEPLFICCWTRILARLLQRPDRSLADAASRGGERAILHHHFFRFWKDLVAASGSHTFFPAAGEAGGGPAGTHQPLLQCKRSPR